MERIELQTTVRKSTGNSPARSLRRSGYIPAVLYGPKADPILLSVNIKDLEQVFKQGNVFQIILNLVIQNGNKITKAAMVKELQTHPVSGNFIHIDFYEIDMKRQINVMVPIVTNGQSVGVENGGMLNIVRREIELLCLPGDIPEAIEIDITDLDIGDSIHIEDIPLGENVEVSADFNFTVVTVLSPTVEEEEVVEEEEGELEAGEEAEGEEAGEADESSEEK
ncbi:MAG: 50S ribosomal protein L25/general stress protein Ctc [Desulfobacterales bacterium]